MTEQRIDDLLKELGESDRASKRAALVKRKLNSVFIYFAVPLELRVYIPTPSPQTEKQYQTARQKLESKFGINSITLARYNVGRKYIESILDWDEKTSKADRETRLRSLSQLIEQLLTRDQVYNTQEAIRKSQRKQKRGQGEPTC